MDTREIAKEYRLGHWAQAIQERVAVKESIKDFCQRTGISRNTYFYWQRKLREEACRKLLPATLSESEKPAVPKGWAVCELEKATPKDGSVSIEIGKCRVTANADASPEFLEKICRMLTSLC